MLQVVALTVAFLALSAGQVWAAAGPRGPRRGSVVWLASIAMAAGLARPLGFASSLVVVEVMAAGGAATAVYGGILALRGDLRLLPMPLRLFGLLLLNCLTFGAGAFAGAMLLFLGLLFGFSVAWSHGS